MFGDSLPDLAVRGEGGIDVFARIDQPDHRRSRFRCLGRVTPGPKAPQAEGYEPEVRADPARLLRAAAALETAEAGAAPFHLTDATGFPRVAPGSDPVVAFLRIDFLRAWTLADQALARFAARLARSPAAEIARPGELAAQAALAYDFNRIATGIALAEALLPALPAPGDCLDAHAYALRMLGDLALRGDRAPLALRCFETAIAIGDNPHRRARARAAAQAAGNADALARHAAPSTDTAA